MSINLLSEEQKKAIYAIEDGNNVFISGGAGTGKSYLLQYLRSNYLGAGLHITASTGIAAVNVGGRTLHSWSGIGLGNLPAQQIIANLFSPKFSKIRRKLKMAKILAIDEISMISASTFDLIDQVLKAIRENDNPFGGLQLILFGDFFQLPPIEKNQNDFQNNYQFCFDAKIWNKLNLKIILLRKVFRQQDEQFISLLDRVRFGNINQKDVEILSSRINLQENNSIIKPTILATHNFQVDQINNEELKKLSGESRNFTAKFSGSPNHIDFLKKNCIANQFLQLKIGSQVMMLKNTYQKEGIINGSLGIVKSFSKKNNYPIVEFNNGKLITIGPETWVLEKFDNLKKEIITEAEMSQIPLILSWAITIHKSQGMSLDKIKCNLGKTFVKGQIYVALSRVKTLEGLYIDEINFKKINADYRIIEFYNNLNMSNA